MSISCKFLQNNFTPAHVVLKWMIICIYLSELTYLAYLINTMLWDATMISFPELFIFSPSSVIFHKMFCSNPCSINTNNQFHILWWTSYSCLQYYWSTYYRVSLSYNNHNFFIFCLFPITFHTKVSYQPTQD